MVDWTRTTPYSLILLNEALKKGRNKMAKVKWTVFRSICLLYVIAACLLFSIKDNDSNGLAYSGEITGYELSPRASKPKYIEEGEEILTKFVFEEISPLGLLVQYQEIDYINNDKIDGYMAFCMSHYFRYVPIACISNIFRRGRILDRKYPYWY